MKKNAKAAPQPQTETVVAIKQDGDFKIILVSEIRPSPDNRKQFSELALTELAASIKTMGVAQPILIRPVTPTAEQPEAYEIVAGERRWRGSKLAGLSEIPAMVRVLSDLDAAKIRILENLQRENPHEMEEAEGYEQLMMKHGYNADQLAEEISKSRAYVYARLKLCSLTSLVREQFLLNKISASTALLIARIAVPNLQFQAYKEIVREGSSIGAMSHREAAGHIQSRYMLDLTQAPFQMSDAKLLAAAGSCVKCPKRTGNQPEVFKDVDADVCTDPDCFAEKRAALTARVVVEANKKGIPVFEDEDDAEDFMDAGDYIPATTYVNSVSMPVDNKHWYTPIEKVLDAKALPEAKAYVRRGEKIVPVFAEQDIRSALEKAGVCESEEQKAERKAAAATNPENIKANEREAAREAKRQADEAKAQVETSYRVTLYKKLRSHGGSQGFSLQSLRELTKRVVGIQGLPDDLLPDVYEFDTTSDESLFAHIDQAELPEIQLILIDLLLGETLGVQRFDIEESGNVDDGEFAYVLAMAKAEGIDPAILREQMFPSAIDTSILQYDDLARIIAATPERINELSKAVLAEVKRHDLIDLLERAAHAHGFVYAAGGWTRATEGATGSVESVRVDGVEQAPLGQAPTDEAAVTTPKAEGKKKTPTKKTAKESSVEKAADPEPARTDSQSDASPAPWPFPKAFDRAAAEQAATVEETTAATA